MTSGVSAVGTPLRIADDIELEVLYEDTTRFGSLASRRLVAEIRARAEPIFRHWQTHGGSATIARSSALLDEALKGSLGELFVGPERLHPELLYPPAERVVARSLVVKREGAAIARVELEPESRANLARWIGLWARRAEPPRGRGPARRLYRSLEAVCAFTRAPPPAPLPAASGHFLGHATVALGDERRGRVLIDPYLLPASSRFGREYVPIVSAQLTNLSAVCVTHSHPDHFCVGAMLGLGADAAVIVPRVKRESALAVDMAARLRELGFERVVELGWGESHPIPGGRVMALPFHGEQPTTGRRLHSQVRNEGNTYLVEMHGERYLAVADSGRDEQGEAIGAAERLRPELGAPDVLFGGYRSFPLYPIEYLPSSVPQYLLFAPRGAWGRRQKIMYDADDLVDLAEAWGARHLVPYACGGAPWYWQRGLGPVLDGAAPLSRCDPVPEVVQRAAQWRTGTEAEPHASPVDVMVLRPGDGFVCHPEGLRRARRAPHAWPYDEVRSAHEPRRREVEQGGRIGGESSGGPRFVQWSARIADPSSPSGRDRVFGLLRRVVPVIAQMKARGDCLGFFFQCKEPGLRLRLELSDRAARSQPELVEELDRARAIGAIEGYAEVVYEPEQRLFGGAQAMAAVHRHFDADTSLLVERLGLQRSTMPHGVLATELWLALVCDDLVARCVVEGGECWDVYSSLQERHGPASATEACEPLPKDIQFESLGERRLFEAYRESNQELASTLHRLGGAGALSAGLRAITESVVQFRFNRYLLAPRAQQAVLGRLLATRQPPGR